MRDPPSSGGSDGESPATDVKATWRARGCRVPPRRAGGKIEENGGMAFARGYALRGFVVVADGPALAAGIGRLCRSPQPSCVSVLACIVQCNRE